LEVGGSIRSCRCGWTKDEDNVRACLSQCDRYSRSNAYDEYVSERDARDVSWVRVSRRELESRTVGGRMDKWVEVRADLCSHP
jgi:hypothetical protein